MLKFCLAVMLLFSLVIAEAQKIKLPAARKNSVTGSKVPLEKKLDSIFSTFNNSTPGIAVTIIQNSKLILKKSYGMASLEYSVPFSHHMLVRIPYSEGRIFISTATALMEKDGVLSLNDEVRKYFPKLPEWSETVTIQDLLNHSSGFADEWATLALTQASMANRLDKSQFLQFLYNQPAPSVEPGKGYMYSNSDFGLLRLILEKASGEDLAAYMKRQIFTPLGMNHTRLHDDKEAVIPNHAFVYNINAGNSYKLWLQDKTSPGGNYYVLTSANDLEKWAAAQADNKSFASQAVERLKQYARPIPVMKETNYVFGQKTRKIGNYNAVVHMGVSELPFLAFIPEKKLAVIMTSNLFLPRWNQMKQVISAVLHLPATASDKPALPDQAIKLNQEDVIQFGGIYKWNSSLTFQSYIPRKRFTEFIAKNGILKIIYGIEDTLDLVPVAKNIFRDPDYPDLFVFSQPNADSTAKLALYTSDGATIHLEKFNSVKPKLEREQVQKLTGKYYSSHLDFYWTIVLDEKGKLVLKRPTIADKIIEPAADGDFLLMMDYGPYSSEGWIKFYFDENGAVSHLTVTHPRLMHHRFDKL